MAALYALIWVPSNAPPLRLRASPHAACRSTPLSSWGSSGRAGGRACLLCMRQLLRGCFGPLPSYSCSSLWG
jgi:hypothetical protein